MTLKDAMKERGLDAAPQFDQPRQPARRETPAAREERTTLAQNDREAERMVKQAETAKTRLDNETRAQAYQDRGVDYSKDVTGRAFPIESERNRAAGVSAGRLRADGTADDTSFDEGKVMALKPRPVEPPEVVALKKVRSDMENVAKYHQTLVKDFDAGPGKILGYDDATQSDTLGSQIDALESDTADKVGAVMGFLPLGTDAGEPTEKAKKAKAGLEELVKQAQAAGADVRNVQELRAHREGLIQQRQRMLEQAGRAEAAKKTAELAFSKTIAERYGFTDNGTPASMLKARAAMKQAAAAGDEEAVRVLAQKATEGFSALDEAAQKRVTKFEPGFWTRVKDLGLSVAKGGQNVLEGIDTIVADVLGTGIRPIQSLADTAGAAAAAVANAAEGRSDLVGDVLSVTPGEGRSTVFADAQSDDLKARRAESRKAVAAAGEGKEGFDKFTAQFGTAFREGISDPVQFTNTLAEQAAMLVPSAAAGRLAAKLAPAAKAAQAARLAAIGTGAVMQGADVADDVKAEIGQVLAGMTAEDAAKVPGIATYLADGKSLEESKAQFLVDEARKAFALGAGASAAVNALPGNVEDIIGRMAAGQVKAGAQGGVKGAVAGAAKAAAVEPLTEIPEELAGRAAVNRGVQQVDPSRRLDEGLGETAAQAAVGALGTGAVVGAADGSRRAAPPAQAQPAPSPAPEPTAPEQPAPVAESDTDPFSPVLDDDLAAELAQSTAGMEEGQAAQTEPAPATPAPTSSSAPVAPAPEPTALDNSQPESPTPSVAEAITPEPAETTEAETQGVAGAATESAPAPAPVSPQPSASPAKQEAPQAQPPRDEATTARENTSAVTAPAPIPAAAGKDTPQAEQSAPLTAVTPSQPPAATSDQPQETPKPTPAPAPAAGTTSNKPLTLWGRKKGQPWIKLTDNTSNAEVARRKKDGWETATYAKGDNPNDLSAPSPRPADVSKKDAKTNTSPAPIVARGANKPAEFVKQIARATGIKGTDTPIRAMFELSNRLHKAAPQAFEGMEVNALSEAEWKANPATGSQTPDSAAAYNPETNTLYLRTERVKQPTALVSALVHESGHFAEKFALPEALVAREWAKLDDSQIEQAAADYNADDARTAAEIRKDPRARSEWVAQQFARVVAGKAKSVPAAIRARLEAFFAAMKEFASKWLGSDFAASPAFDREVLRVMGFDENAEPVATTSSEPISSPSAPAPSLPAAGGVTAPVPAAEPAPKKAKRKKADANQGELEILGAPRTQTDSPAFKAWFGDSKVVDAEGKPRVMYHGTSADVNFEAFDEAKMDPKALFGPGIYTTASAAIAGGTDADSRGYAGKGSGAASRVLPLFVKIEKPFDADQFPVSPMAVAEEMDRVASKLFDEATYLGIDFDLIDRMETQQNVDNGSLFLVLAKSFASDKKVNAQRVLREMGHDGIIHTGGLSAKWNPDVKTPHTVAIAFKPEQVKSAIGNRGTFDPATPSILGTPAEGDPDPVPLTDAEKDAARRELAGEEGRTVLNPPKNAEVPGSGGKQRYRSHTDTLLERGYQAVERVPYTVMTDAYAKQAASAFIDAAGEATAISAVFDPSMKLQEKVRTAIGAQIIAKLSARAFDPKLNEVQRIEAASQFASFRARFAERGTELGQGAQGYNLIDQFTPAGALMSAGEQATTRQDVMLGKDGRDAEKEIVDAVNGENAKVIDQLLKDVKADVRKVKVTKKMVERVAGELPKTKKELDAAIRSAFEDTNRRISDILHTHHTQADAIGAGIVDKLVQEAGLSRAEAEKLAEAVRLRLAALTEDAKRKVLARLSRDKGGVARRIFSKTIIDKVVDMSNSGAIDQPALRIRVADELKLPRVTDALAQRLKDLTDKYQRTPEGQFRDRVATDILSEMRKIKGVGKVDVATAIYYAHILSGYTTQLVNIISTGFNVSADVANEVLRAEARAIFTRNGGTAGTATGQALAGLLSGGRMGMTIARSILDTGYAQRAFDAKVPEVSPILEILSKEPAGTVGGKALKGYSTLLRYITRLMRASDAVFYRSASEAFQRVAAAKIVGAQGAMSREETNSKIRDLLGTGPAQYEAAVTQAKGEGFTGYELGLRVGEILEQGRNRELVKVGDRKALEATFNSTPRGALGTIAKGVGDVANKLPALKLFVPFTNIVANVTNASLNYSPLGALRAVRGYAGESGMTDAQRKDAGIPDPKDERGALFVKAFAGTAAMVALLAYAMSGEDDDEAVPLITAGGPKGPEGANQRRQLRESGWAPYTIRIGDKRVSYLSFPSAVPLAFVGNIADGIRYNDLAKHDYVSAMVQGTVGIASTLTEMSFLQGIADLFDTLREKEGKTPERFAANVASSALVPNLVKQIDRTFDDTYRRGAGFSGEVAATIPGLRQSQPAVLTNTGKEVASQPLSRFGRTETPDPLWDVLNTKGVVLGEFRSRKVGDRKTTPEEERVIVLESGPRIERKLRAALPILRSAKAEAAQKLVNKIADQERDRAMNMLPALMRRAGQPVSRG